MKKSRNVKQARGKCVGSRFVRFVRNLKMKKWRYVKQARVESDRISKLPDSLILSILELLPMRDVVRTTILSKRWKNLWTTVSCLNFNDNMYMMKYPESFVNRALKSWRGVKILKFKIDFWRGSWSLTSRHVDSWVRLAMDHQVEELNIHLTSPVRLLKHDTSDPYFCWGRELYCVPQDLYSCSWLKVLSLKRCRLDIEGDVCVLWNQLKSLTIHGNLIDDGNAINRILSASPQLEIFDLSLTCSNHNLIFRSTSLRKLSINTYFYYSKDSPSTELVIWTPNLETLKMSGTPYPKCLLMDVSSLTRVTLGFKGGDNALRQILPRIQHVERVTLGHWCIKALGAVKKEFFPSPFPNVKLLQLKTCLADLETVVGVLEMLSGVKTLVLGFELNPEARKVERNLPKSFLRRLRTVEVTWSADDNSIFPLIEFLLKYARKLEKMVFRNGSRRWTLAPSNSFSSAFQTLLTLPRSSPTAHLIFSGY